MSEPSPLQEAQQALAEAVPFRALGVESCALDEALGRTLHADFTAPLDAPPYPRAIVEGFLVNTEETAEASEQAPARFKVSGRVQPGDDQCPAVKPGEAVQVATGSVVAEGPYSIVRMWEAEQDGDTINVTRPFPPRFFIEEQGCDIQSGSVVWPAGTLIGPWQIGTVASLGVDRLEVVKRPRVTVFASGDEVIPHNEPLATGKILDCNTPMLSAAIREAGGEARRGGIQSDDFEAFVKTARAALEDSDMLVIAGGTAVGGRDFISDLLRELGELKVDGVPMRSGRPLIMGVAQGKPIVCVAGHPPEALRGFRLFGVAALNRLLGRDLPLPEDA